MKTSIKLLLVVLLGITTFACKKEKEPVVNEQEEMQKEFLENLSSYPSNPKQLIAEGLEPGNYTLMKIPKVEKIEFSLEGKSYSGTLENPLYVLQRNEGTIEMEN